MSLTNDQLETRLDELELRAVREGERAAKAGEGFLARHPRALLAVGVVVALLAAIVLLVPDAAALGAWIGTHAAWTVQVAFLAVAAVLVVAAFLLLQITIHDPLLIEPEVKRTWLEWHKGYREGERSEQDGAFMLAGAVVAGATMLMMALITLGVFYAGAAL